MYFHHYMHTAFEWVQCNSVLLEPGVDATLENHRQILKDKKILFQLGIHMYFYF